MDCLELATFEIYRSLFAGFIAGILFSIFLFFLFLKFMHEETPRPVDFIGHEGK